MHPETFDKIFINGKNILLYFCEKLIEIKQYLNLKEIVKVDRWLRCED
jgi:hypothetical protein